jgi:hypothetical protein
MKVIFVHSMSSLCAYIYNIGILHSCPPWATNYALHPTTMNTVPSRMGSAPYEGMASDTVIAQCRACSRVATCGRLLKQTLNLASRN